MSCGISNASIREGSDVMLAVIAGNGHRKFSAGNIIAPRDLYSPVGFFVPAVYDMYGFFKFHDNARSQILATLLRHHCEYCTDDMDMDEDSIYNSRPDYVNTYLETIIMDVMETKKKIGIRGLRDGTVYDLHIFPVLKTVFDAVLNSKSGSASYESELLEVQNTQYSSRPRCKPDVIPLQRGTANGPYLAYELMTAAYDYHYNGNVPVLELQSAYAEMKFITDMLGNMNRHYHPVLTSTTQRNEEHIMREMMICEAVLKHESAMNGNLSKTALNYAASETFRLSTILQSMEEYEYSLDYIDRFKDELKKYSTTRNKLGGSVRISPDCPKVILDVVNEISVLKGSGYRYIDLEN